MNIPSNVRKAIKAMDDLGFESTARAAREILGHADYAERWEIDAEYRQIISTWRNERLAGGISLIYR